MGSSNKSSAPSFLKFIAVASLTLALLSFVSPQVSMLGRGLRTTLPALAVTFFAISFISPTAFIRAFVRFWPTFLIAFIFVIQAAFRFAYGDDTKALWSTFVVGPLLSLAFLLCIASLAELGEDVVHRLRCWLLFAWCASIAVGLPILIMKPGVARLTMGNPLAQQNAAIWAPYGVGEYHVYTSLAICLGPLLVVALQLNNLWKWVGILLLCMSAAAVLFSTFTMAAAVLVFCFFASLVIWANVGRGVLRILRILLVLVPVVLLPLLYSEAKNYPQTEFITSKLERLYKGISTAGLAKGDETTRGKMFMKEMETFSKEPFLGLTSGSLIMKSHGHSSLTNSLVLFGVLGAALWCAALYKVFRDSLRNTEESIIRRAIWIGWLALLGCGILNPIWHSASALSALFALTLPTRKNLIV